MMTKGSFPAIGKEHQKAGIIYPPGFFFWGAIFPVGPAELASGLMTFFIKGTVK
jgi:hypothetical protein